MTPSTPEPAQLVRWLRLAQDGDVLMTHPGQDDTSGVADPIASARLRELAVLQSPQWPQLLARHGVTVERMAAVDPVLVAPAQAGAHSAVESPPSA